MKKFNDDLLTACKNAKLNSKVIALIDNGINVNATDSKTGESALLIATEANNITIVRKLIEAGADVNKQSNDEYNPLVASIKSGNYDLFKVIFDANVNLNIITKFGSTPLMHAAQVGNLNIVKDLVASGANVNAKQKDNTTSLMLSSNHLITKILIEAGANVNLTDNEGRTALMFAKTPEMVDILIDAGADVLHLDNNGNDIFHEAIYFNRDSVVNQLAKYVSNINKLDKMEKSPLYYACWYGNFECVKVFIEKNADVNIKNKKGDTPLHAAVNLYASTIRHVLGNEKSEILTIKNRTKIVKLLIDSGANVKLKNEKEETALIYLEKMKADKEHMSEIIKLLKSKEGCYIATAVYGSYNHPKVILLRNFRDTYLLHSKIGKFLVMIYYKTSPPIGKLVNKNLIIKDILRYFLEHITNIVCKYNVR